ncbi:hypothetical protein F4V45_03150 [Helicobacter canis]|uniref:Uncharacterized protein n=2 Tax=Helicobacter canis TaxID=29419 RepID=A0A5M9QRG4_9HELI|nr:hypothetical protein [Helicobacter canis]KAA8710322.1 hypothetical protein F4V45_03150 [Helicobacter canis]
MSNLSETFLEILQDNEWHCAICDLHASSQHAAIIRDLVKEGHEFDNESANAIRKYKYGVRMYCKKCQKETTHRKLK